MENIHILDTETVESLINMLNSEDKDNIKIALSILNNADFTDFTGNNVVEFVSGLNDRCYGLHFALFQNKKGNIRPRFVYILTRIQSSYNGGRYEMIDDETTLDNEEWFPYEPYNDLSSDFKFKYIKK